MNSEAPDIELNIDDCWNRIGIWRQGEEICPRLAEIMHCHNCEVYAKSGRAMLQRPLAPQAREEFTRIYAEQPEQQRKQNRSLVIFRLGDEWLGINSGIVEEITSARPIQRLPHTHHTLVKGLVNMRGEMQLCVSLGGLLGLERGDHKPRIGSVGIGDRMIQIQHEGNRYVIPVTEVYGLHHFNDGDLHSPPATISKAKATYTRGVLKWKEANVALLDDELLFYTLSRSLR